MNETAYAEKQIYRVLIEAPIETGKFTFRARLLLGVYALMAPMTPKSMSDAVARAVSSFGNDVEFAPKKAYVQAR